MRSYSDLIDRVLLQDDLLEALTPSEPLSCEIMLRIREADDATLSGGRTIGDAAHFPLIRGGLFYVVDALDDGHRIFQEDHSDLGSYWHGMMHRREGDFENARYWFRRAGSLPNAAALHRAASEHSALMARQTSWDAYLLTGECERASRGDTESIKECRALLRVEFDAVFDYCWRQSVAV